MAVFVHLVHDIKLKSNAFFMLTNDYCSYFFINSTVVTDIQGYFTIGEAVQVQVF